MKTFKIENAPELFFDTKEKYLDFVKWWSENKKHNMSSEDMLIYMAVRGKDVGKAFSPIKNPKNIPSKGEYSFSALYNTYSWSIESKKRITHEHSKKIILKRWNNFFTWEEYVNILNLIDNPQVWKDL